MVDLGNSFRELFYFIFYDILFICKTKKYIIQGTKKKIISDQIHVAMTKTCGLVATLACQSNTFYSKENCSREFSAHTVHLMIKEDE
jgi:hypothetical protein